jgi:thymidylate synthase ThyX
MRVTLVSLRPTDAALAQGRPALTPELLAATGARYSRSDDGLDAILARLDPENADASVDRIFQFVDYGHASIADMAPVALFIDGVSMWLAYELFRIAPTAGGQESSTRYIRMGPEGLIDPNTLGIDEPAAWSARMDVAFAAYTAAVSFWERVATADPTRVRIPDGTPRKAAERMRRNFAFDRARYFLPVAAQTNTMLVMSARAWVGVCQHLLSHPLPEANRCGDAIQTELGLATPRLLRHARRVDSIARGLEAEFLDRRAAARAPIPPDHGAHLEIFAPDGIRPAADLALHDNRYGYFGEGLRRTAVRFGWDAVAFAEIRDLNRHRTGTRHCPLAPVGFYAATDQLLAPDAAYEALVDVGLTATQTARTALIGGDPAYIYGALLGTQFPFEHTTTADKFLYEAELRTGNGAHFRYAEHLRDALALWYERYPETRGLVLEGSAEPE